MVNAENKSAEPTVPVNEWGLSRFMLGTSQLGIEGYGINNRIGDRVDARALLDASVRAGIDAYDTAAIYGDAEIKLGNYFRDKRKPFVVSKLKVDRDATTAAAIERSMIGKTETILSRLQLDCLPALLLHDPEILRTHGDTVTKTMRKLRRDGLIRQAGLSYGPVPVSEYEWTYEWVGDDVYEVIQVAMNVFDRRVVDSGAWGQFVRWGKWTAVRSVFLQGLFFLDGPQLPARFRTEADLLLKRLRQLAEAENMSVAQLALAYVRDFAGVHFLVIGAETPEQIVDNVALMNGPRLSEQTRATIERTFADLPELIVTPAMWTEQ